MVHLISISIFWLTDGTNQRAFFWKREIPSIQSIESSSKPPLQKLSFGLDHLRCSEVNDMRDGNKVLASNGDDLPLLYSKLLILYVMYWSNDLCRFLNWTQHYSTSTIPTLALCPVADSGLPAVCLGFVDSANRVEEFMIHQAVMVQQIIIMEKSTLIFEWGLH